MAVAFDAFSVGTAGTGNLSHTHTPTGTPRGILHFVVQINSSADRVTGATYGGTGLTEVTGSPLLLTTGEVAVVYAYFLGASVPSGAQTVATTTDGSGVGTRLAYTISMTAAADLELVDVDATINAVLADPSVSLSLGGRSAFCALAGVSGQNAIGGVTPFTGWTARDRTDTGTQVGLCFTYNTVGTTDVTAGWTQTSEEASMIAVAVAEVAGPPQESVSDSEANTDTATGTLGVAASVADADASTDAATGALTTAQSLTDAGAEADSVVLGFRFDLPDDDTTEADTASAYVVVAVSLTDGEAEADSASETVSEGGNTEAVSDANAEADTVTVRIVARPILEDANAEADAATLVLTVPMSLSDAEALSEALTVVASVVLIPARNTFTVGARTRLFAVGARTRTFHSGL